MTPGADLDQLFIGWDVGGWNCDKNPNSRDALVILDADGQRIGQPWRGNLRQTINASETGAAFLAAFLALCKVSKAADHVQATLAIDASLGFPEAFTSLIARRTAVAELGQSAANPYLYRLTERRLAEEGITPLSAIKDMIGSQSTKAMHVLARFAPHPIATGVWSDGEALTMIETYPALCRARARGVFTELTKSIKGREADIIDAEVCAHIAHVFALRRDWLEAPPSNAPPSEGWIWAPLPQINSKQVQS
ncbi:hypothetical protein OAN307_c26360 [Octadecabacter antarcticus 307]|uniref:DUF429 domain-containing protein n=1 Tax=Octadecabacter antarcticus 307 TaxID=391626 RepID=M9REI5_9RHOB|nr:hypothetical protein [Octadecabacter antarcticus]AGI68225.1 hypothetical protein OAN307_c26360 [Octadecabacter antarcticus 307]